MHCSPEHTPLHRERPPLVPPTPHLAGEHGSRSCAQLSSRRRPGATVCMPRVGGSTRPHVSNSSDGRREHPDAKLCLNRIVSPCVRGPSDLTRGEGGDPTAQEPLPILALVGKVTVAIEAVSQQPPRESRHPRSQPSQVQPPRGGSIAPRVGARPKRAHPDRSATLGEQLHRVCTRL